MISRETLRIQRAHDCPYSHQPCRDWPERSETSIGLLLPLLPPVWLSAVIMDDLRLLISNRHENDTSAIIKEIHEVCKGLSGRKVGKDFVHRFSSPTSGMWL